MAGPGNQYGASGPGSGGAGAGGVAGGGGGGAGYYGGGGGGSDAVGGGGGGGGSDYCAPSVAGCNTSATPSTGSAQVNITYTVAASPTLSITAPANGANYVLGQAVTSNFSCSEGAGGPGLAACLDQGGRGPGNPVDTSFAGQHAFTVTATSSDGEASTATVTYTVAAPPLIQLTFPESGAAYVRGQHFVSEFRCVDGTGGPGIASCIDQSGRASDSFVDTSTLGVHVFTVTAASKDGLVTSAIARYRVVSRATLSKFTIRHGLIALTIKVPAGGAIDAIATTRFKRTPLYARSHVFSGRSGNVPILVIPSRAGKRLLERQRRLTIRLLIAYTPSGGLPQTVATATRRITR